MARTSSGNHLLVGPVIRSHDAVGLRIFHISTALQRKKKNQKERKRRRPNRHNFSHALITYKGRGGSEAEALKVGSPPLSPSLFI
jgi:hypothetical protein